MSLSFLCLQSNNYHSRPITVSLSSISSLFCANCFLRHHILDQAYNLKELRSMSSVNASNGGMLRLSNQGQTVRKRVNIFACSLNQNSGSLFRAFCPKGRPHFSLFTKFKLIKPYKIMVITAWVSIFEKSLCCTLLGVRPAKWEIALHIFAFMVYVECMFNNQS